MRRSPRVLLAWAAAVVVMLATVRVVAADLGSLHRRAHNLGADVPVVLAARDLPLGTTLGAGDVHTVRRPSTTVSSDALRDPAAAVGRVVSVALLRDDVVGARHLVAGDGRGVGPGINGIVPVGRRAVHVLVKDGFQPPIGSVVDVLATYDPSLANIAGSPGQATIVAHGARVLTLAGAAPAGDLGASAGSNGSGVELLVTEDEARSVAYAASIGEVSLALAPLQTACCSAPAS
ncbi:MAG: SAF domain-containing protein [Actinomycetota bacterium]|nr:SAF domain-containing protein [Actinomycetota bacterium]